MNAKHRRLGALFGALTALTLGAAACGGGGGDTTAVIISGSSTVQPISSRNAEAFREANPDVDITVDGPGTGDGFELFCNGQTDISDASRPIKAEEIAICEENSIEYTELRVAIDGISVLTSPDNDAVECLSFLDLYALIGPESQGFGNWSDADELADELTAELDVAEAGAPHTPYPDASLEINGPGEESGTFDSFVELVIEGIAEQRGADTTTRPDYQSSPNDNVIVEGLSTSPASLGWVGYAYYLENRNAVKVIEVDGGDGCVAPTEETIADGSYPVARPLFIYVNDVSAAENPDVKDFVDFYLSDEGRAAVSDAGYVQLTDDEWQATVDTWNESAV